MTRTLLLSLVASALLSTPAASGAATDATAVAGATTTTVLEPAPAAPAVPRPVRFDAEAATAAYLATQSGPARARSDAYFEGGYWLLLWDFLVGLSLAWLLLGTGLSRWMRERATHLTRHTWLQAALYSLQYIVLTTLITLPWAAYEGYFREHQYGMSNQSAGAWLGDQLKGLVIMAIMGTFLLTALYAVIRRAPRTWWLWGTLVAIAFAIFQNVIGPTLLEPVFNKFYPLAESPLKQQILSMARANEIPVNQVYEYDASRQTTRISAHVSGLLGSAQISLNDNLMKRASPEEVRAVLGHEMGHYVMNHIYKSILPQALMILLGFALVR